VDLTSLIFSVLAFILALTSFIFGILNFIEIRAQKLSTHQIQFVDPSKEWEKELDQLNAQEKEANELDNVF
jgi:hypothetical protein